MNKLKHMVILSVAAVFVCGDRHADVARLEAGKHRKGPRNA